MGEIKRLVSISIPFYNSERFLSEAIESVIAQTHSNWELFLVDDGSTDHSTELARNYASQSGGQIHYLEHSGHRNCGVNSARNLGARSSHGRYLAFLDSDDVWLPKKLEQQIALMDEHPQAGLIYGPSEYWYDWDIDMSPQEPNHIPLLAPGGKMYSPPTLLTSSYPIGYFGAPCPSSFLVRREAFDCVDGFEECFNTTTHQLYEDMAFLAKIYLAVPVYVSGLCLDRYRCHPLSMWHSAKGTNIEESARKFYFRWLKRYLRSQDIADPDIWRAVRRKFWVYSLPLPLSSTRFLRRIANRIDSATSRDR